MRPPGPVAGRIVSMVQQHEPENNEVKVKALEKVVDLYPKFDTFVHDRACEFVHCGSQRSGFREMGRCPRS